MPSKSKPTGRPAFIAPDGWVTIQDAADRRGVSYSVVYRHVKQDEVHWKQLANGVILVDENDLKYIAKHEPPADRDRIPVQLSPNPRRHKAWTRAARKAGVTVTEFAYRLLDNSAGFSE